jgi:hypothetical protein
MATMTHAHIRSFSPCSLPEKALSEFDYYMDTHKLRITVSNMKNANTVVQLQSMRDTVLQNLSQLPPAPSVPFTRPPPKYQVVSLSQLRLLHRSKCPPLCSISMWASKCVSLVLLAMLPRSAVTVMGVLPGCCACTYPVPAVHS